MSTTREPLPLAAMTDADLRVIAACGDGNKLAQDEATEAAQILKARKKYPTETGFYWFFDESPADHACPFGYGRWYIVAVVDGRVLIPGLTRHTDVRHYREVGGRWGPRVELSEGLDLANIALPDDRPLSRWEEV